MATLHPMLPRLSHRDIVLRDTTHGWRVEDATGRPMCESLASIAEARLIGRTFVPARGKVWMCRTTGWVLLDDD